MNNRKMIINRNKTALKECLSGERHIAVSPDKKCFFIERELFVNREKEHMPFIISIVIDSEKGLFNFDLSFCSYLSAFHEMLAILCSKLALTFSPYSFFVFNNKMISRYTHYMSDDVINEEKLNEIINGFERILKRSYGYTRKVCNGILPDIMDLVRVELDYIDEDASANKKKESDESAKEADDCCKNCDHPSILCPFECDKNKRSTTKPLVLNNNGNPLFDFEDDDNDTHKTIDCDASPDFFKRGE